MYKLTEINIYPVKSLGGILLQSSQAEERGLKYDRRWMIVDENNQFISQRKYPQLSLLWQAINESLFIINHKQNKIEPLSIPLSPYNEEEINVQIWKDKIPAIKYHSDVNEWFTEAIGLKCSLVYMPDTTKRTVDPKYVDNQIVSFADGYPFLIIGEESLVNLNNRLKDPLPMNRFRPNLVFDGGKPFDEDGWKRFRIGAIEFHSIKPCSRCVVTTVDQDTSNRGKEPLKTLAQYRKVNGKVMFGMNLVCEGTGNVNVGDQINHL
ncbi:MAG: MOSC domain-containing protein [Ignavibacteria bacterium]|nr:MOSC domain-containing protein [Ignavibacteria bacterium]